MQVWGYAGLQVWKYGSNQSCNCAIMEVCNYAVMQVCKYARMQVYKYVSMQVCRNAGKNSYQILVCSNRETQRELECGLAQSNLFCLKSILKQTFC